MLKLKLQYFGHLMRRVDSLEKSLMLGDSKAETLLCQQGLSSQGYGFSSVHVWL